MNSQDYTQYWQQHIDQCQALAMSGSAYCKQHQLSYHKFVYWRRKLRDADSEPAAAQASGFIKVVPAQRCSTTLTLILPGGISVSGFDANNIELLGAVLRQL